MYSVYAIGKKEDLMPPYDNCYIGVTNDIDLRWNYHSKSKYRVGNTIRKHGLTLEENFVVLHSAVDDDECFLLENALRPEPNMGLNLAAGGCGGNTGAYTEERNMKMRAALKGRKLTWADKIVESRRSYSGNGNPQAATWIVTSPAGEVFEIIGTFQSFCDEHNLLASCLRYYKGKEVPPLEKSFGGYRAKNEISKEKRINTIGWKCEKCSSTGGDLLS